MSLNLQIFIGGAVERLLAEVLFFIDKINLLLFTARKKVIVVQPI